MYLYVPKAKNPKCVFIVTFKDRRCGLWFKLWCGCEGDNVRRGDYAERKRHAEQNLSTEFTSASPLTSTTSAYHFLDCHWASWGLRAVDVCVTPSPCYDHFGFAYSAGAELSASIRLCANLSCGEGARACSTCLCHTSQCFHKTTP